MSLFTASETLPFGVAFALIIGIALIEGLGMMVALSPSHMLDQWLPDSDSDTDLDATSGLGWLHIGRVPSLVLLLLFLSGYAVFGYAMQVLARALLGSYLPVWLAGIAAVAPGLATVRGLGAVLAHLIPKDETFAVSEQSLIGRVGVVMGGTARRGLAAQVRVRDMHGRVHFLMAEPDLDDEEFHEGASVLLVRKIGAFYRCIANPHSSLM